MNSSGPSSTKWIAFLAIVWFICGCGPSEPMAKLSGVVSYEGQPIAEGLIVISSAEQGVYITAEIVDGAYEIRTATQGVPPGVYRVAVTPPIVDHPVGPILERPRAEAFPNIPQRYRDEATSGFTADLKDGINELNYEMSK